MVLASGARASGASRGSNSGSGQVVAVAVAVRRGRSFSSMIVLRIGDIGW